MPFVKLDCGLLTSTLWADDVGRLVFLTALMMAEPKEFDESIPQVNVRDLEASGWEAPPGWYGYVPAAGVGICRMAGVDQETGLTALVRLGSPEPDSRSPEYEGRRLIRINGGYLVLNFQKYRDRDYTTAARSARYRQRKGASRRDSGESHRDITQAEAEAEAEGEEKPLKIERESIPPDPEELKKYFIENGSDINEAQACYAFYKSKGWIVGKTPMKSWRGSAAGWILRERKKAGAS